MAILRTAVVGAAAVTVLLTGCTSSKHPAASHTPTPSTPAASSSQPSVIAPLLPSSSVATSAGPWSADVAGSKFQELLDAFNAATVGSAPPDGSSFTEYVQYSQRIANACDPFLTGLRQGLWPVNAQLAIVQYQRLEQVVCDVELARGQAGNIEEYKGVQPPPENTQSQLLADRLKIYKLLGI